MRLNKTVVMVGMMGAGKTAVGTALARLLAVPFRDSDDEIVSAASRSIAEIFERDGEPFFRARETEVLARLMATQPIHDDQAVVRRALEARRDALIDLHLEGLIDRAEFTRRREEMQRQLEDLRPTIVTALPPDLSRLADGVPRLDAEEYQQLLSDLGVQFKVKGTHVEVCALNVPQLVKSIV